MEKNLIDQSNLEDLTIFKEAIHEENCEVSTHFNLTENETNQPTLASCILNDKTGNPGQKIWAKNNQRRATTLYRGKLRRTPR